MTLTFQASVIFVQDIAASRRFYEELLGQEVEMDHGASVTFTGGLALWQVDHAFEMIYERTPDSTEQAGRRDHELHFETTDAQATSVRLLGAGVEFVHPVREMPWGKRIFRVCDPDGQIVAIGEQMSAVVARLLGQGMSARAVAERTGMPLEIVARIAEGAT
jgi:catechol 2,3-dioxygenase-like lactoylglutathione lyase family enzyme